MWNLITSLDAWAALISLTALEIVLGIDNVVFISVLVQRLDQGRRDRARRFGLALALICRIALLFSLTSLMGLSATVFVVWDNPVSWHELVLIGGGLFLIAKATHEMHAQIEGRGEGAPPDDPAAPKSHRAMGAVVGQIIIIDLVFSINSVVTAIGMAQDIRIMVAAVLIAVAIMYAASGPVAGFVAAHPTTKTLALAFLLLVGVALVADGFEVHIPRGYIYFAMAFAAAVEMVNIWAAHRRRRGAGVKRQE